MPSTSSSIALDAATLLDLDLGGSKLIEASAGTGKTHTIADLYLRHILAGRQPAEILVVTYTIAATEELRGRIRRRLYRTLDLLQRNTDPEDEFMALLLQRWRDFDTAARDDWLYRLQLALRSMDEAAISTIHGFCQRSLQQQALSGKQFFDSEVLANDDAIWEDAIKDWWRRQTYPLDSAAWNLLQDELPGLESISKTLLELRNRPRLRLLPPDRADSAELLIRMRDLTLRLHRLAPQWQGHRDAIVDILLQSKDLSRNKDLPYQKPDLETIFQAADAFFAEPDPVVPFEKFHFMGSESLRRNSKPSRRGKDPQLEHQFFVALDPIVRDWNEYCASILPSLLADALEWVAGRVEEVKQKMPALAFQDQLSQLLDALESDSGAVMVEGLRRRYPVAMIDEFQDTDSIQYQIFRQIYQHDDTSLTLIGDPKQAIYSFRGGDIFTYMQARRLSSIVHYSLQINWRSQTHLVDAINTLFSQRADAFVYHDSIPFVPATPATQTPAQALHLPDGPASALTLWQLPLSVQGKNYNRDDMRELINRAVVIEIAGLLGQADAPPAMLGERAVQSGDIAILVRTAREGQDLSRILHENGIRSVTIGRDSVFHSDEARGLHELLLAIARYREPLQARRSLASGLLDLDYRQIAAVVDSESRWQEWLDDLGELHQVWERQGFITMFEALLHRFDVTTCLTRRNNNERRLTNLLHLAELLHQQTTHSAGMSPLLGWLAEQFDQPGDEEAELRLENDEALVKIVTIHKAKGLQYPIVFVPFLWTCRAVRSDRPFFFHDAALLPCVDLGSAEREQHWRLAEKERLAEDLRLLYVALTRAQSRVYLAWGMAGADRSAGSSRQTALAYLLHSRQSAQQLELEPVDGFPDDMDFDSDLKVLVERSDNSIEVVPLPQGELPARVAAVSTLSATAQPSEFGRTGLARWRISSFTGLTRGIHQPQMSGAVESEGDAILDFPAGSHVGLLLHSLLEHLDFQAPIDVQCATLLPRFLPGSGLSSEADRRTLISWLESIVSTTLDDSGLTLANLDRTQRLNELAFDFALDRFDVEALNHLLQSLTATPLQAVSSPEFGGLITGVIDLVFEHQGKYYLADYKSNFLGTRLEDYAPDQLERVMLQRRYDLQSLLYAVALHRYLAQRLDDYAYERHFGGCYYLFLRALRPARGNRFGVHFARPELDHLLALDRLFEFTPTAEVTT